MAKSLVRLPADNIFRHYFIKRVISIIQ